MFWAIDSSRNSFKGYDSLSDREQSDIGSALDMLLAEGFQPAVTSSKTHFPK